MTERARVARQLAVVACAGVLVAGCSSGPQSADDRLCAEVERIAGELAQLDDLEGQDARILGSHLILATTGDPEGTPSPELAETIHAAGLQVTSSRRPLLRGHLETSFAACEDAGIEMDRGPLEAVDDR